MSSAAALGNKRVSRTSSMPPSPPKRRKLDTLLLPTPAPSAKPPEPSGHKVPSAQEIFSWTLTEGAVAPCFVKDVYDMKDSGVPGCEFFWLGRVPCRTVVLTGIVVGIQVYEKRTIYTVDDGTATIDCAYGHPPQAPPAIPSPTKKISKTKHPSDKDDVLAKYRAPPLPPVKSPSVLPSTSGLLPPPPPPVAKVGQPVRMKGRVITWKERFGGYLKRILVDEIAPCVSSNEEAKHWLTVLNLHRTNYRNDALGPFVVPKPTCVPSSSTLLPVPITPSRRASHAVDPSFTSSTRASSIASSPSTSPSKVTSSDAEAKPKLRHPSRLHSRDLTENTFRIYVKHYMENAPALLPHIDSGEESEGPADMEELLATPTKPRRAQQSASDLSTPRAMNNSPERTPRASRSLAPSAPTHLSTQETLGFTLSYLRRVSELAALARRVVAAEGRRRARKEKHAAILRDCSSQKTRSSNTPQPLQAAQLLRPKAGHEPYGPKMKRLFATTIIKLYEEGAIVLWEGPTRPLPHPDMFLAQRSGGMWKGDASSMTDRNTSSLSLRSSQNQDHLDPSMSFSSKMLRSLDGPRASSQADEDEDEGTLSDPPANEDAYVPLTPTLLAPHVERAVGILVERERRQARTLPNARAAKAGAARRTELGATKENIAAFLSRCDEQWAKLGAWAVQDTLERLEEEGRVWCIGNGKWEPCL